MTRKTAKASKKPMPPHVEQAWSEYFASKNPAAKDVLIEHYQFLVKQLMRPFWHKKPFILDHDDLISAGNIGLIQAIERYSADRETMFETFSQLRIKGAILDEINALDWTPRGVRRNIRTVIKAEERLLALGIAISPESISEITDLSVEEVVTAKNQSTRTYILPVNQDSLREIETHFTEGELESSFAGFLNDEKERSAKDSWNSLMSDLTDHEKKVLLVRFFYEETMVKTAKILGVSVNNVSMSQASAFNKIRAARERTKSF